MTYQEVNLSRRSIQNFDRNKPIKFELVKRVISEATFAPSGYNLQPWRVIVVQSEESKNKLHALAYEQQKILDAPITLIVVADKESYKRHNKIWDHLSLEHGEDKILETIERLSKGYGKDELTKTRHAHTNTSLFSMNLMALFKSYNIDSHPIGGFKELEVKEAFGINEYEDINMLISIGYHDESKPLITRKRRKTFEEITTIF